MNFHRNELEVRRKQLVKNNKQVVERGKVDDYFCFEINQKVVCQKKPKELQRPPADDSNRQCSRSKNDLDEKNSKLLTANSVLDVTEMPNGHKQLKFKFNNFLPSGLSKELTSLWSDEEKSDMADTLLDYLSLETNFKDLRKSAEYRKVLKKLAFMSMGDKLPLSKDDESLIGSLAEEIKPLVVDVVNEEGVDDKESFSNLKSENSGENADDTIPGEAP